MAKPIEPRTLPGFRDLLPDTMRIRNRVIAIFRQIFEKYGFEPLETPTIEYQDILLGKYGAEAEKLMYLFKDNGGRDVGLRYDLTVPAARVLAQYPNLPKPFKRYQIQSAWRAEKPQKGRYREFTQCDIDTFGTSSPLADAEIIAVIYECLTAVGFENFSIRLNSRKILFDILTKVGISQNEDQLSVLRTLDKLDKKPADEVWTELKSKGVSARAVVELKKSVDKATVSDDPDLAKIYQLAARLGAKNIEFKPYLVRGLDYYTNAIFEAIVEKPKIGSVAGGGRYDNLIGQFTGQNIPAVGTTLGLDRIVDVISSLNLWPDIERSATRVLVTIFSPSLLPTSLEIVARLRREELNAEIYLDPTAKLDKQLKYADQKGIPYAVIIGPEEAKKNLVTVKDLRTKNQKTVSISDLLDEIR